MKKKGFTLVELLAVIVILAIIAIIATPIILNVIETAKKASIEDSVYGIADAAEMYFAKNQVNDDNFNGGILSVNDLSYKGKIDSGSVVINNKGKYAILIYNGKYCGYKYIGGQKAYVGEITEGGCKIDGNIITLSDLLIASGQDGNSNQTIVETATIHENGNIKIKDDNYFIKSDGSIIKNGNEITNETEKNEAYEKVVKAILSSTESTAKMLEHQEIIDGIKTNDNAVSIICDGFIDYLNAANVIDKIKESVQYINENADKLVGGTAVIQEGNVVKNELNNYTDSLYNVVSKIDVIMINYEAILQKDDFIDLISNFVMEDTELLKKALNNENFVNIAFENSNFANRLYQKYDVAESIIASSTVTLNAMKNSSKYKTKKCSSQIRIGALTSSEMAKASTCVNNKAFILDVDFYGSDSLGIVIGDFINNDSIYFYSKGQASKYNKEEINRFAKDLKIASYGTSAYMEVIFYYYEISD